MKKLTVGLVVTMLWLGTAWAGAPAVEEMAGKKASILEKMHQKAAKSLVNVAQDKVFSDYFNATDDASRQQAKVGIDNISLKVQSEFHVEEMCFIEATGKESSRIVGNQIAVDLSDDESGAAFFKPSMEQKPKTVYHAPPYVSTDVNKWVLAYTSPIMVNNEKKGILHYEMGLDQYQTALNKDMKGDDFFIVAVTQDGWLVSDSRKEISPAKKGESKNPEDYFVKFKFGGLDAPELINRLKTPDNGIKEGDSVYVGSHKVVVNLTLFVFQKQ